MTYVTRFVITQSKDGQRVLADPQQGRFTYATADEAQERLDAMLSNNSQERLREVFGLPLEVRPCKCYAGHFDPAQYAFS